MTFSQVQAIREDVPQTSSPRWQDITITLKWTETTGGSTGFYALVTVGEDFVWDCGLRSRSPSQALRGVADEIDRDPTIYKLLLQEVP